MGIFWGLQIHAQRPGGGYRGEWNAAAWEEAVLRTLRQVTSTVVGRVVIRFAEIQRNLIHIFPQDSTRSFEPANVSAVSFPDGYRRGVRIHFEDRNRPPAIGTGRPSDARLRFTPGNYVRYNRCNLHEGVGSFGDAILLHELVHAVRVLEGTNDPSPTPRWYGIDGFEEFCAITVTNMYRSELNRALIMRHARGTERTHLLDPWGDSHPTARLQWERDSLREFVRQQPVFTGLLRNIPLRTCPYNPFAEYLDRGSNRIPVAHATGRRSARCGHDVRGR